MEVFGFALVLEELTKSQGLALNQYQTQTKYLPDCQKVKSLQNAFDQRLLANTKERLE